MIKVYMRDNQTICAVDLSTLEGVIDKHQIIWIDLISPSNDEINHIASCYGIEFPTKQEREEIELSSRYWEDHYSITINAYFFVAFFFARHTKDPYNETVTFIVQDDILVTMRYRELKTFEEISKRLISRKESRLNGYDVMIQIFDVRVDADADILEYAAKEINTMRQKIFSEHKQSAEEILHRIAQIQEFNLRIRETVFDKRRIVASLQKSNKIAPKLKDELAILSKDIHSLIEFTTINLNALDNLQNLFLGQINIEQNKIIKLFTVASVALMPPTLVASLYGMNFQYMPELSWKLGYPFAIAMMTISAFIPLIYFRKRGWL